MMKKKLLSIIASMLCLCMLATACGANTNNAGNAGGSVKDFSQIGLQPLA